MSTARPEESSWTTVMLRIALAGVLVLLLAPVQGDAQVVREDDQKSIAGVLGGTYPAEGFWTLKSAGREIVFASLDAEIYLAREGHEEGGTTACAEAAGDGCEDDGGPPRFCLQVVNASWAVMCQSTRPAPPPGWQRDPRLACVLPVTGTPATYAVRVSTTLDGACTAPWAAPPTTVERPFLLNLSLRRIAPSGTSIHQATAQSNNR